MDKRTAWVSWILFLGILLGLGGMYYGQTERIDVLQRESKEKETQIQTLNSRIAQSQSQLKAQEQKINQLQQKMEAQQKVIGEIQHHANF